MAEGGCDGCTLCCVVFRIDALGKPPFHPCRHLAGHGCGIYRAAERPAVCAGFTCRYIDAHRGGTVERDRLPHPKHAGAYLFQQPGARVMVLCIDPDRPQAWRDTAIPAFLAAAMEDGFLVAIHDRGYSFTIAERGHLAEVVARDCVAVAAAMGIAPNGTGAAGRP
ncbi:hypothetical protein [Azospirillum sp. A39]|uniref:hypothetical protein n=1 Tax=Azospirillum sp. A39 TaxID=3462279 RepID=UPI004045F1C3